jgi:hypothetical protein
LNKKASIFLFDFGVVLSAVFLGVFFLLYFFRQRKKREVKRNRFKNTVHIQAGKDQGSIDHQEQIHI